MKTVKYLAMLATAFALSLSFVSCSDDDDNSKSPAAGELKAGGMTVKLRSAGSFVGEEHTEIWFLSEDMENPDAVPGDLSAHVMIDINTFGKVGDGRSIPTGTFPYISGNSFEVQEPCYQLLNLGIMNEKAHNELWCYPMDDCGPLKIEKKGDIYTITISKLHIGYTKDGKEVTETTSFTYKGKIRLDDM